MGLLNMDKFDKYGTQQMPLLKNLMQMANLNICKAYQKNFRNLPRIASFIGTSNHFDLLTDPTGSRRFICIEAEHLIDCEGIMHDQIYAQLKAERLSASDIFRRLKKYNPAAMRGSNPATFAQVLLAAGVTRKHTKYGNVYLVKPMKAA